MKNNQFSAFVELDQKDLKQINGGVLGLLILAGRAAVAAWKIPAVRTAVIRTAKAGAAAFGAKMAWDNTKG